MKHRAHLILFSGIVLLLTCGFFSWAKAHCAAPMPVPSSPGGYYEDAFILTLSAPEDGTIYYTTDGSTPTSNSHVYKDGILLHNRSQEPNVCHSVQNIVPDWKNHTPITTPVEKGTVIRAVYVNSLGIRSEILTQTYFVGIAPLEEGYALSLIFEHEVFFGDQGIYVTGKEYDEWYLSGGDLSAMPVPNFQKELEVPVILQIMDASGTVLNQQIGARIQGASARNELYKRLTLVARPEYSGNNVFDIPLYEGVTTHSVMLKHYSADAMAYDFLSDRSISLQKNIPVRLYLNGEHMYDCYMLERYDSHYFKQYYQVEDRAIVKKGTLDEDTLATSGIDFYSEFLYWVSNTDFSDPAQWEAFQQEADVQSYIDYLVANYFFCNIDFNEYRNYVLWRSPQNLGDGYNDMRWRWCIYDIDVLNWIPGTIIGDCPEAINVFSNDLLSDMNDSSLYRSLRNSPEFRKMFVLSFMDMYNNNFTVENAQKILEKYGFDLNWTDGYFQKRPAYATAHLAEEFGLTGALETVTITTAQPEMGSITVNTSVIDLSSGSWTGSYFTDYPITVTANAMDGYEFIGWKGDADGSDHTLTLSLDGGVMLEAVFAKIK